MGFMCPHLVEQYHLKVSEILNSYKPQIVLKVSYKDVCDGLILRDILYQEEHNSILKIKNPQSQVEALLLIIPKRMWGLENFITVLINQNVDVWLMEELFQAYIRHLVTNIKKQQEEKKCECLLLKDCSIFRRGWINVLKMFDAWIYTVGTSVGFMSQTLYPMENSLGFINNILPLPLPAKPFQLHHPSLGYTDDQSVIVTEIDDDDVFEQGNAAITHPGSNQIIGLIPRETIVKPIRAITNGLIITPLKALNLSLTRSVDCLANMTRTNFLTESLINKYEATDSLHKINAEKQPETNLSPRSSLKSHVIFSHPLSKFSFSPSSCSPIERSLLSSSTSSLNSPLARISEKYSIGAHKSSLKNSSRSSSTASLSTPSLKAVKNSPKSIPKSGPSKSSTSSIKSSSTSTKSPSSPTRVLKSSSTLTRSSPSLFKSPTSQKSKTVSSTQRSRTAPIKSSIPPQTNSPDQIFKLPVDFVLDTNPDINEVDVEPESPSDSPILSRSVGTNTIFHHSTIQGSLNKSSPTIPQSNKPKSTITSSASPPRNRNSSTSPRYGTSMIDMKKVSSSLSSSKSLDEDPVIIEDDKETINFSIADPVIIEDDEETINFSIVDPVFIDDDEETINFSIADPVLIEDDIEKQSPISLSSPPRTSTVSINGKVISINAVKATTALNQDSISNEVNTTEENESATEISSIKGTTSSNESITKNSSEADKTPNADSTVVKKNGTVPKSPKLKSDISPKTKTTSKGSTSTSKNVLKRSISSMVDRLSKPKAKPVVVETRRTSLPTSENVAAGTIATKSPAMLRKITKTSGNTKEVSKSESNIDFESKKLAKKASKAPPKPKFNASTKIKPPPPPPQLYDRLAPEDYASQMLNIEWFASKKWEDPNLATVIH